MEEEQQGAERAGYKEYLLKNLSGQLVAEFGDGYSKRQLELFRQLYLTFPIANAVRSQLTWTHYKLLVRIADHDKREFFIPEAIKNAWSVRQMERQINSLLYATADGAVHSVIRIFRTTAADRKTCNTQFYNLDTEKSRKQQLSGISGWFN